jgi:tight adherence protein C
MGLGLGVGAFFLAAVLGLYTISEIVLERRRVIRGLRGLRSIDVPAHDVARLELASAFSTRVALPAVRHLGRVARRFTPAGLMARLTRDLTYAGQPAGWDAERMIAVKILGGAGLGGLTLLLGILAGAVLIKVFLAAAILACVGFFVPDAILSSRYQERQHAMQVALADALDVLSITVEAGLGFDAALARVSQEIQGPLGQEMQRVLQEMQLGKARADAFRDLSERTTVADLKSFVLAMVQADIFGISVAGILQVQSKEIRIKRRQAAEERAQKVQVKILIPLIFCILPAMFVILIGPAVIQIFRTLFPH